MWCDNYVSPHFGGETLFLARPSVCLSVTKFVSATPLKLLIRFWQNFTCSKDIICSCAYYQGILIPLFLCELYPFKLRILPKLVINNVISATPLKLPIWFLRNLICSKEILFSCVYYQEILIPIFWGVMSFELRILPKLLINNCKCNCFETLQLTAQGEMCFCLQKQTLIFKRIILQM